MSTPSQYQSTCFVHYKVQYVSIAFRVLVYRVCTLKSSVGVYYLQSVGVHALCTIWQCRRLLLSEYQCRRFVHYFLVYSSFSSRVFVHTLIHYIIVYVCTTFRELVYTLCTIYNLVCVYHLQNISVNYLYTMNKVGQYHFQSVGVHM